MLPTAFDQDPPTPMDEHPISARLVRRGEAEKEFDREFWRRAGPQARFEAAWEMVLEVYRMRGENADDPPFLRSVAVLKRRKG